MRCCWSIASIAAGACAAGELARVRGERLRDGRSALLCAAADKAATGAIGGVVGKFLRFTAVLYQV